MKLYGISLCLALVVAVKASDDGIGSCLLYLPAINPQGATDSSIKSISSFGELAVVAFDPNADEAPLKCISMKFDSGKNEYIIKYQLADGTDVTKNGTYEVKKFEVDILIIGKVGTTFYEMSGLDDTKLFGNGKMFPIYVGKNEVILKSCISGGFLGVEAYRSTYMLTTIAKAAENEGCNCPEWKKSIE